MKLLFTLLTLLFTTTAWGAIAFDSTCSGTTTSSSSITVTCVAPSTSNVIMVCAANREGGSLGVSSATYNGVAMTVLSAPSYFFGTRTMTNMYLLSPTSGSHSFTVTFTGSANQTVANCGFYTGVSAIGAYTSQAEVVSKAITTQNASSWIVSHIGSLDPDTYAVAGSLDTERLEAGSAELDMAIGDGDTTIAGSYTATWTHSLGNSNSAITVVELVAAAPPATATSSYASGTTYATGTVYLK